MAAGLNDATVIRYKLRVGAQMLLRFFIAVLSAILAVFSCAAAQAQQQILEQDGLYKLFLIFPDANGHFEAAVQYPSGGLMANVSDQCQTSLDATLIILDGNLVIAYQKSGDANDLKAYDMAARMGKLIERACPAVETVSFKLSHIQSPATAFSVKRSEGWGVTNAPLVPQNRRVPLSQISRALQSPEGVSCNSPAEIFIDSRNVTTLSGRPSNVLRDYRSMVETSSKIYSIMCPNTDVLKFYPSSLPDDVTCALGKGECYLEATRNPNLPPPQPISRAPRGSREEMAARLRAMTTLRAGSDDWRVEYMGYTGKEKSETPSIETFGVLIDLLIDGDYSLIRNNYQNYFRLFHNQFLFAYSDKCSRYISDPEVILITPYEETVYGDGTRSNRRQTAPTYPLTLSKSRKSAYMQYDGMIKVWLTRRMFSETVNVRNIEERPNVAGNLLGTLMSDKGRIDTLLGNGCQDSRVQAVYNSLDDVL